MKHPRVVTSVAALATAAITCSAVLVPGAAPASATTPSSASVPELVQGLLFQQGPVSNLVYGAASTHPVPSVYSKTEATVLHEAAAAPAQAQTARRDLESGNPVSVQAGIDTLASWLGQALKTDLSAPAYAALVTSANNASRQLSAAGVGGTSSTTPTAASLSGNGTVNYMDQANVLYAVDVVASVVAVDSVFFLVAAFINPFLGPVTSQSAVQADKYIAQVTQALHPAST